MRPAPFGAAAMEQHHVRVFGMDLVEPVPDGAMVVEFQTTGEGDLGPAGSSTSACRCGAWQR